MDNFVPLCVSCIRKVKFPIWDGWSQFFLVAVRYTGREREVGGGGGGGRERGAIPLVEYARKLHPKGGGTFFALCHTCHKVYIVGLLHSSYSKLQDYIKTPECKIPVIS